MLWRILKRISVFLATMSGIRIIWESIDSTKNSVSDVVEYGTLTPVRVFAYNANSDRRTDIDSEQGRVIGRAFPELSVMSRWPLNNAFLKEMMESDGDTIFAIQELDAEHLALVNNLLDDNGYTSLPARYNPSALAMNQIVAVSERYRILKNEMLYYTLTGEASTDAEKAALSRTEKLVKHLGVEFERSAQLISLRDLWSMEDFLLVVTHPGLPEAHRIAAAKMLATRLKDETRVLIVGDLNLYAEDVSEPLPSRKQVASLESGGLRWLSEHLCENGGTFIAYPYDVDWKLTPSQREKVHHLKTTQQVDLLRTYFLDFATENDLSSTCLDAAFGKGIKKDKTRSLTFFKGHVVDTKKVDIRGAGPVPIIPSDHAALEIEFHFR